MAMRVNGLIVLLLTGLVAATYGFGIYLFAQLVPDMRASLGFDIAYVGTITAAGQAGFLASALLAAWLTPRVGGGWVIFASGAVCALALLLMPLAQNIVLIGVLLTVLAGTAATVFVPMVDVISRAVPYQYRGMAMGLVSSGTSYGVFINSLLVPLYAPRGEWRTVWWIVTILTVVLAAGVFLVFKRARLFACERDHAGTPRPGRSVLREALQGWVYKVWSMNFLMVSRPFRFRTISLPTCARSWVSASITPRRYGQASASSACSAAWRWVRCRTGSGCARRCCWCTPASRRRR
jgi:MFS family permease